MQTKEVRAKSVNSGVPPGNSSVKRPDPMRGVWWVAFFLYLLPWLKMARHLGDFELGIAILSIGGVVLLCMTEAMMMSSLLRGFMLGQTHARNRYGDPLISVKTNPINFVFQMVCNFVFVAATVGASVLVAIHG